LSVADIGTTPESSRTVSAVDEEWYEPDRVYDCAICGKIIEPTGYDPCRVMIDAARPRVDGTYMAWEFWAHAACVPTALESSLADAVRNSYDFPPD
jgi:hypothetical protein